MTGWKIAKQMLRNMPLFDELKAQNSKQIPGDKSDQKLRHVVTSHDVMNHDVTNCGVMS